MRSPGDSHVAFRRGEVICARADAALQFSLSLTGGSRRLPVSERAGACLIRGDREAARAAVERRTGCPVIVTTSFNVRGEPIVGAPEDAVRCFMRTDMDVLVLENFLLLKSEQAPVVPVADHESWRKEFVLD